MTKRLRSLTNSRSVAASASRKLSFRCFVTRCERSGQSSNRPVRIPTLEELTPEQRADYEALGRLVQEAKPFIKPGATSDHGDMYDEYGLPI